jgi:hypothetical protein
VTKKHETVNSPRNVHPPKMKLPAKAQTNDSPPESDEEEMSSPMVSPRKFSEELFQVNIEVKSPRSPAKEKLEVGKRSKYRLDKLLSMTPSSY